MIRVAIICLLTFVGVFSLVSFGEQIVKALIPYQQSAVLLGSVAAVTTALIAFSGSLINVVGNDTLSKRKRLDAEQDQKANEIRELAAIAATTAAELGVACETVAMPPNARPDILAFPYIENNLKEIGLLGPDAAMFAVSAMECCKATMTMKLQRNFSATKHIEYRDGVLETPDHFYNQIDNMVARSALIYVFFWEISERLRKGHDPKIEGTFRRLPYQRFETFVRQQRVRFLFKALNEAAECFSFPDTFAEQHNYLVYPEVEGTLQIRI